MRPFTSVIMRFVRAGVPEDIEVRHALKPPVDPYLRVQKTEAQDALSYLHRVAEQRFPFLPASLIPLASL